MLVEIGDYGEVEAIATAYTLVIYEQEFKGRDLIADVFGKSDVKSDGKGDGEDDGTVVIDFTSERWLNDLRALWAMVVTAYELAYDRGDAAPNDRPKPFMEWAKGIGKVNMRSITYALLGECMDGFFHTGAAVSE